MRYLARHWARIALSLIPLIFALYHATGVLRLGALQSLDNIIYDARLRATMAQTMDERVVIVDVDEQSLAKVGRWPWGRNKLAEITNELFVRQQAALLGFDMVFGEPDHSSGLQNLQKLARNELRDLPAVDEQVRALQGKLDYDAQFAQALRPWPVVLGYYFTSDQSGHANGQLPAAVLNQAALGGRPIATTTWTGYGANIAQIADAAKLAGFFNAVTDDDGVVRSVPLLAEYQGRYYETLALAMFRQFQASPRPPTLRPYFAANAMLPVAQQRLSGVQIMTQLHHVQTIALDDRAAVLVPYRGYGGPEGRSYRYISAADVLAKRLPAQQLKGKIVLLGSSAPGLLDLRITPVGQTYPGVETHANLISAMLDGKSIYKPDYAIGYDVLVLLLTGLTLAFALPRLTALRALALNLGVLCLVVGLNFYLFLVHNMVLPLAAALTMSVMTFMLNMSYGYFVESRAKRQLASLFGTYVPPQLVDEMVRRPRQRGHEHSMRAVNKEMTIMFCDLRGFTEMAEQMAPMRLQALLNGVFSRLTDIIGSHLGTIDKYMGDCIMAFWGAPLDMANHADLAVRAALDIVAALEDINTEHALNGLPMIELGIGMASGTMCVGDMGSNVRRSYTVLGDVVNLASRLEDLTKSYGVPIVVSQATRDLAPGYAWQQLDTVQVKGKQQKVTIFTPKIGPD